MPRVNYISKLQEENAALRKQLEEQQVVAPIEKKNDVKDYRDNIVSIVYGPHAQALKQVEMPLRDAFTTLVDFYSMMELSTNKNVPKTWNDRITGDGVNVNSTTVYAKMTYRDKKQKQIISVIRDMPLWLAVDNAVQQGKEVELISEAEFLEWYKDLQLKDRMSDNTFRNMLHKRQLEAAVEAELEKAKEL